MTKKYKRTDFSDDDNYTEYEIELENGVKMPAYIRHDQTLDEVVSEWPLKSPVKRHRKVK